MEKIKISFLAPANNYHTKKWCDYFVNRGYDVSVISFFPGEIEKVHVHYIDCGMQASKSDLQKLSYLFQAFKVKKILNKIKPDVISVHYASSYGAVAALTGIKGYFLSIWGSDVYEFPEKSLFHKLLIKFSLWRAHELLSTSKAMATHASQYTHKSFKITPFGVRTDFFSPFKRIKDDNLFIIGTVKSIEPKYGIDYLIKAVAVFKKMNPDAKFQLRIAGKGTYEETYKKLANSLGLESETKWLGFISQEDAAKEWANMDVAVVPSTVESESFGVSAVEAQACGTALIISDIPGLMEATDPGRSCIVVQRKNEIELAKAINRLYLNNNLRQNLGKCGIAFVEKNYTYESCFKNIEKILLNLTI